jgi:hypothetical protein
VDGIGLHDVEEGLLAHAILLLEELVLGVRPGNVAPDYLGPMLKVLRIIFSKKRLNPKCHNYKFVSNVSQNDNFVSKVSPTYIKII